MAYIGSTPTSQSFIAGTDTFSGTGSQTAFTLSRAVNSVNDILVVVNNVDQQPNAYSVSGLTLTMSAAPSAGTNNVYVRYLSTTLQSIAPSQGSVGTDQIQTNAITTDKIAAGAVVPADLSTGAPTWTAGSLFQFNSGYGSNATAYGCRAWVNFNGTGTVAIRASGNVSSITDNGTGDYTVNFTTAMPDANYAASVTNQSTFFSGQAFSTTCAINESAGSISTNSLRVVHIPAGDVSAYNGALNDTAVMCVIVFR